jgi:hypothetical protein
MISLEQLNANRANAQESTGPTTEEGKRRSSMNAARFGLTGRTVILPADDFQAYEAFRARWVEDLKPKGAQEHEFVQTIVDCKWRLNRARTSEDGIHAVGFQCFNEEIDTGHPAADEAIAAALTAEHYSRSLDNMSRHETRVSRMFNKALEQLKQTQAERKAQEKAELEQAIQVYKLHKMLDQPYEPKEFGFVLSVIQVEKRMRTRETVRQAEIAEKSGYSLEKFRRMLQCDTARARK